MTFKHLANTFTRLPLLLVLALAVSLSFATVQGTHIDRTEMSQPHAMTMLETTNSIASHVTIDCEECDDGCSYCYHGPLIHSLSFTFLPSTTSHAQQTLLGFPMQTRHRIDRPPIN